jgi:hypothetical protein
MTTARDRQAVSSAMGNIRPIEWQAYYLGDGRFGFIELSAADGKWHAIIDCSTVAVVDSRAEAVAKLKGAANGR